ncbi:hypothetical protein AJ79_06465 [Helicocarpus griseus UAMH5409]|uniref:Elongin-A n=1 Tax=Helicocarpus griseus UAMH5409 TaxID=1447875 RepID=A0A2B7XD38_9EURO|nr:hypothetical protein AJ79_06465 [Helicocarpus griseus UAMH5409]
MPAPSLLYLAQKACLKITKRIDDIGLIRYDLIRPILQKIENPEKLHELELKSPHLLQHDAELWIEFIKRDVPGFDQLVLPENPDSWYDVYHELLDKNAREVDEDAERMRRALLGLDRQKAQQGAKVVDLQKMRLPKEKPSSMQRHAHFDRKMGGITPVFVSNVKEPGGKGITPYDQTPRWKFETPKLPRLSSSPAPRKSALPLVKRNQRLCTPTHRLNSSASGVVNAPRSLVEDYKRPAEPKIPRPRTNDPRSSMSSLNGISLRESEAKHSKSLLTSSSATSPRTPSINRQNLLIPSRDKALATSPSALNLNDSQFKTTHPSPMQPRQNSPKSSSEETKPISLRPVIRKRPATESVLVKPKRKRVL